MGGSAIARQSSAASFSPGTSRFSKKIDQSIIFSTFEPRTQMLQLKSGWHNWAKHLQFALLWACSGLSICSPAEGLWSARLPVWRSPSRGSVGTWRSMISYILYPFSFVLVSYLELDSWAKKEEELTWRRRFGSARWYPRPRWKGKCRKGRRRWSRQCSTCPRTWGNKDIIWKPKEIYFTCFVVPRNKTLTVNIPYCSLLKIVRTIEINLNKVTTCWEGPQSLSYHQCSMSKVGTAQSYIRSRVQREVILEVGCSTRLY